MATHRSTDMASRSLKSYSSLLGIAAQQYRDNSGFYVAAGICKRLNSALARAAGRLYHDVLPRTTNFSFVCCSSTIRFWYTLPILTTAPVEIMLRMSF